MPTVVSAYTKVYSVICSSGSVPRKVIFSPRETSHEVHKGPFLSTRFTTRTSGLKDEGWAGGGGGVYRVGFRVQGSGRSV